METPPRVPLSKRRILIAFALAALVDALHLPLNFLFLKAALSNTSPIPAALAEIGLGLIAAKATIALLGFHWLLLPAVILELVPVLNLLPIWTVGVAFVVWRRQRNQRAQDLAAGVAEPASSPRLFRSQEAVVIGVLVVPALLLAFWLLHGLRAPPPPNAKPVISNAERMAQAVVASAQRKVDSAKERCDAVTRKFELVFKPGPEPDWFWHPLDHSAWATKKAIWEKARAEYEEKMEEASRTRREAEDELRQLTTDLAKIASTPEMANEVKSAWARYVVPTLHFLLAFSLCRFSARSVFRFFLLKDRIGAIRL